jgi:glycine dehydrogenase
MVEPTESESLYELNRFIEAMISIYREIEAVIAGGSKTDNPLKNAPHTQLMIAGETWPHPYTRKQAAFPSESCEKSKFWPTVRRVDDAFGDRNLVCSCRSVETYR